VTRFDQAGRRALAGFTARVPLAQLGAAYAMLESRRSTGKIIRTP
jgi:hypothetical protein